MTFRVFIDESGNTGDIRIKRENDDFNFNRQPYFVLAGIGVLDIHQERLEAFVTDLRQKYRVQSPELKSTNLYQSKPELILELIDWVLREKFPIFVEINDKKYFLCMQINNIICRSILTDEPTDLLLATLRAAADYLYNVLPTSVFTRFTAACTVRNDTAFDVFIESLKTALRAHIDDFGLVLYYALMDSLEKCTELSRAVGKPVCGILLPEPDRGTKGQIVSSLPNIPALSSIMSRVEQYRRDHEFSETIFVHDEQAHFFEILQENMTWLETEDFSSFSENNHLQGVVHYHLDPVTLVEGHSKSELAIQVADVLAGVVFRLWSEFIGSSYQFPKKFMGAFQGLVSSFDGHHPSVGVNFVVPQKHFDACIQVLATANKPDSQYTQPR